MASFLRRSTPKSLTNSPDSADEDQLSRERLEDSKVNNLKYTYQSSLEKVSVEDLLSQTQNKIERGTPLEEPEISRLLRFIEGYDDPIMDRSYRILRRHYLDSYERAEPWEDLENVLEIREYALEHEDEELINRLEEEIYPLSWEEMDSETLADGKSIDELYDELRHEIGLSKNKRHAVTGVGTGVGIILGYVFGGPPAAIGAGIIAYVFTREENSYLESDLSEITDDDWQPGN